MGANSNLPLAIEVIVTTTRAGVRSLEVAGRYELIEPTVERGMDLLASLERRGVASPDETLLADARRELSELRSGVAGSRADRN